MQPFSTDSWTGSSTADRERTVLGKGMVLCAAVLGLFSCGGPAEPNTIESGNAESDTGEVDSAEAAPVEEADNWRDALLQLSESNVSAYSYVVYEGNLRDYPYLKFGVKIRLGIAPGVGICPQDWDAASVPVDGWSLSVRAADIQEGEYVFSSDVGNEVFSERENMRFVGDLERFSGGKSVGRYVASQGRLELASPIVPFEDRDSAAPISGSLHLTFPAVSVRPLSCSSVHFADGTRSTTCTCLLDDTDTVECIPEGFEDACCLRQVPQEFIEIAINFEAPPCATMCTSVGIGGTGACNSLQSSGFDAASSP